MSFALSPARLATGGQRYTKMLTGYSKAATKFLTAFLIVATASGPVYADGNPLFNLENNLNDLIFELSQSVVTVQASAKTSDPRLGGPSDESYRNTYVSGIVCDTGGYIVTAASEVVGKDRLSVKLHNQQVAARLVAIDYQTELALLRCAHAVGRPVDYSQGQACAGQMVIAMGNAYGLRSAPALGFCAGVRDDGSMQFSVSVPRDAVGGGIFDLSGRLMGIILGSPDEQEQATFAVPGYSLPSIIEYLIANGDRQSGFLGVTTEEVEVDPPIRIEYPQAVASHVAYRATMVDRGVVLNEVLQNSPAARAGLQQGDLIFAVDDIAVNSASGLANLIRRTLPGTPIMLELIRGKEYLVIRADIGQKHTFYSQSSGNPAEGLTEQARKVDSLKQEFNQFVEEVRRLERRLDMIH